MPLYHVIITHNPHIADCARRVVKLRDGLVEEDSSSKGS